MELDLLLKKHFLLENNEHGMVLVESEAKRDLAIATFAPAMKVNKYDIIALDENRAMNIYQYKEKIANELAEKNFMIVKGTEFFCSTLAQDILRFYEKRSKALKVLIIETSPVNKSSESYMVALNYAGEKLLYEDENVQSTGARGRILKLHPENCIGFYELLDDSGAEYVFDIKKSMTSGMLKLRKDKQFWYSNPDITGQAMLDKYFDYTNEVPSVKDMETFVGAMRKMEIPPRMILL